MASKAQMSVEFYVFIGLAFIVAIAFEVASIDQLNDFRLKKESEAVKDLALKLQKEVLVAAAVEDGYARNFDIPDTLDNINYSLVTQNSTIAVESKNSFYIVSIPNSVGNVIKGANKINKTGGVIYINNGKPSGFADFNVCQNAQTNGLCAGLDISYGLGYQASCCSEYSLCC